LVLVVAVAAEIVDIDDRRFVAVRQKRSTSMTASWSHAVRASSSSRRGQTRPGSYRSLDLFIRHPSFVDAHLFVAHQAAFV